jgi:hypothetical protein
MQQVGKTQVTMVHRKLSEKGKQQNERIQKKKKTKEGEKMFTEWIVGLTRSGRRTLKIYRCALPMCLENHEQRFKMCV